MKLEQTVRLSDHQLLEEDNDSTLEAEVSQNSKCDYVFYHLSASSCLKLLVIEVKTNKSVSVNSVAQIIGYYIASTAETSGYIPLGVVFTQSTAILVFYPYRSRRTVYVDAIATKEINISDQINFMTILSFIVKYISHLDNSTSAIGSSRTLKLHDKDVVKRKVLTVKEFNEIITKKLEEETRKRREAEGEVRRVKKEAEGEVQRVKEEAEREVQRLKNELLVAQRRATEAEERLSGKRRK